MSRIWILYHDAGEMSKFECSMGALTPSSKVVLLRGRTTALGSGR